MKSTHLWLHPQSKISSISRLISIRKTYSLLLFTSPVRLARSRTLGFHPSNRGSNPLRDASLLADDSTAHLECGENLSEFREGDRVVLAGEARSREQMRITTINRLHR